MQPHGPQYVQRTYYYVSVPVCVCIHVYMCVCACIFYESICVDACVCVYISVLCGWPWCRTADVVVLVLRCTVWFWVTLTSRGCSRPIVSSVQPTSYSTSSSSSSFYSTCSLPSSMTPTQRSNPIWLNRPMSSSSVNTSRRYTVHTKHEPCHVASSSLLRLAHLKIVL